jgi:hypothetical protein
MTTAYSCNAKLFHPTYFCNKKYTVKHSVYFILATLIVQNACSQLTVKSSGTTAALCCLPKKGHESRYLSTSVGKMADQFSVVCSTT